MSKFKDEDVIIIAKALVGHHMTYESIMSETRCIYCDSIDLSDDNDEYTEIIHSVLCPVTTAINILKERTDE